MDKLHGLWTFSSQASRQTLLPPRSVLQTKTKCCQKVSRTGSKGAVLVVAWTFFVYGIVFNPVYNMPSKPIPESLPWAAVVGLGVIVLVAPVTGLLASIYFGRYRAVYAGLWLMWVGCVITVPLFWLQRFLPDSSPIPSYCGSFVAVVGSFVGFTLYVVNAVPFGLDQIPDASGEQISTFLRWYTWAMCACPVAITLANSAIINCTHIGISDLSLFQSLLSTAFLSVALSSNFLLRGWLIIEPKGKNPLKTFFGVLRFAARHKVPVRRSAFTYCETGMPSRLDLGKSKYGGPFTNEEVEDVKTCLRMVLVIASITVTSCTFAACLFSLYEALRTEFTYLHYFLWCPRVPLHSTAYLATLLVLILGLPVYEVLIHPLIRKWIPSTLRKVGFSLTLIITSSFLLLVSTTVWYLYTDPNTCMFADYGSAHFHIDHSLLDVPFLLVTYTLVFLLHMAMLEFVCAQAPYILRGLLVGFVYSVFVIGTFLGLGVYVVWRVTYQEKAPNSPSCGVWFYLFTTITATLGCVLWCAVAKWYKRRERDEPDMCRIFAENYYSH